MTLSVAAGSSATAAFVSSIAPAGIVKPTDESVTTNTTLQADNDLFAVLPANSWAQNTSSATAAIVHSGSSLTLWRLS